MTILPKTVYRFSAIPLKMLMAFFTELEQKKIILICMETQKTTNSQSNPGKEKWSWKNQSSGDFKLKVMLIYYSQSPRTFKNYTKSTLLMLYKWKYKTRMTAYLYPMVYWIF